jgi:pyruvate,water dikinase
MKTPLSGALILGLDSPEATVESVGGKGASLARLSAAGLPVPPGFHVTTRAYRRFVDENRLGGPILAAAAQAQPSDPASLDRASAQIRSLIGDGAMPGDIAEAIRRSYGGLGADVAVAVRSSATAEDLPSMSFAGQMESYLNVRGGDAVIDAVRRCWASLWTGRAIGYRGRQGIRPGDVGIAVVVQQLVLAEAAGVAFTANPVTGARDELVINAAWGLGEAIVSGQVTPDAITIDKRTGAITSQQIAAKEAMTVRTADGTREEAVPDDKRTRAALEPSQAAELARLCARIEVLYGQAMDIEWAACGGRIFIVQARPVTVLARSRAEFDWRLPLEGRKYWRSSAAELLPDPLSPLFATLALPLWNEALQAMAESTRMRLLIDRGVGLVTIHGYAYYSFAFTAWGTMRLLAASPVLIPRMIRALRSAESVWANEARPRYAKAAGDCSGRDLDSTPALELLAASREIVGAAAGYYVSIQLVLGAVNGSEAVFTNAYNRLIMRGSDPPASAFLLGFESAPIGAEKSLYDLAMWARPQAELAAYLARTGGRDIAAALGSPSAPIGDAAGWREFAGRLTGHLRRYGHCVYDLDFAKGVPSEEPGSLIETLKYFASGRGRNPHERQASAAAARELAAGAVAARLGGLRLRLFRWSLRWAQHCAPLREDALADVGLGWPVVRRMLREAGRRLAAAGALAERDDVFFLTWDEAQAAARALDAGQPAGDHRRAVAERRETWKLEQGVPPPVVLPVKGGGRLLGIDVRRLMPARSGQTARDAIKGTGASPGRVTGPARVIHGPGEFEQMRPGDILVAKITTPAWTPLFALASGVVTDVGGPLSHSSIVAREYGIPAVLGTGDATRRIRSGQQVTVDGDSGLVKVDAGGAMGPD